jgi:hypothetical protein
MGQVLGGLGLFGILLFIVLGIILPISVYAAQKWAYKCFRELQALNRKLSELPRSPETHVKCPDCRELVLKDARKCRYCGCTLVPQ